MHFTTNPKSLQIVKASAGSGKTHTLTQEFLKLIFTSEKAYQKVLAVTFTNKATAEMKGRIMEILKAIALKDPNGEAEDFINALKEHYKEWTNEILFSKADRIYREILHDYSRLNVSTIDKFVLKVIRGLTYEFEIDHHFQVELNTEKVIDEISTQMHETLQEEKELLDWYLSIAAQKLENSKNWDFRKELVSFVRSILFSEDFIKMQQDLRQIPEKDIFKKIQLKAINAKQELEEFQEELLKEFYAIFQKFYAFEPEGLNKTNAKTIGIFFQNNSNLKINNLEDLIERLKKENKFFNKKYQSDAINEEFLNTLYTFWYSVESKYDNLKNNFEFFSLLEESNQFLRICITLSKHLADYRKKHGVLLISDATNLLYQIAKDHEDNPSFIWEKIGQRFQYFLIDEFQDTSKTQWENFKPLIKNAIAENPPNNLSHLIVGDVKQSIYRWRGGDWDLLENKVKKDIGSEYVDDDRILDTNYRSKENIVAFNNALYSFLPSYIQKHLNEDLIPELFPENQEEVWIKKGYDKRLLKIYEEKSTVQKLSPFAIENPYKGVVELIPIPVENNSFRFSRNKEKIYEHLGDKIAYWLKNKIYSASQIGILVRTNNEAKEIIATIAASYPHIPLVNADAFIIKENIAIQLLNYCMLYAQTGIDEGQKKTLLLQIIHAYYEVLLLKNDEKYHKLTAIDYNNIKDIATIKDAKEFLPEKFCVYWEKIVHYPTMEFVEQCINLLNLDNYTPFIPYLLTYREAISSSNENYGASIEQFLQFWEEEKGNIVLPEGSQGEFIEVVTVHRSKGLAYDVVLIPTLSWSMSSLKDRKRNYKWWKVDSEKVPHLDTFPINFSDKAIPHFPEESAEEIFMQYVDALNELYVATTRAKNHLIMYYVLESDKLNLKPSSYIISDFLHAFIQKKYNKPINDEKITIIGEEIPQIKNQKITNNTIELQKYPTSQQFELAYTSKKVLEDDLLAQFPAQELGIWAHQMMEWHFQEKNCIQLLEKNKNQGKITKELFIKLQEIYSIIQKDPQLLQFEKYKEYILLNEQDIINVEGKAFRPDIIWISTKEKSACILDFKFTSKGSKKHHQQVEKYKKLLYQMDFLHVEAYLYYGLENPQLITV